MRINQWRTIKTWKWNCSHSQTIKKTNRRPYVMSLKRLKPYVWLLKGRYIYTIVARKCSFSYLDPPTLHTKNNSVFSQFQFVDSSVIFLLFRSVVLCNLLHKVYLHQVFAVHYSFTLYRTLKNTNSSFVYRGMLHTDDDDHVFDVHFYCATHMHTCRAVYAVVWCLSVCLSVTRVYCVETTESS